MDAIAGIVVAFSGGIGSGKSSLSRAVATDLACPRVSFGDYVRKVAVDRGIGLDRKSLQFVGESLTHEGWLKFCLGVLNQADWQPGQQLVIDGVRHVDAVRTLRLMIEPGRFRLVGISLDQARRWARKGVAGEIDREVIRSIERHSTEVEVESKVVPLADLVVDGSRALDELVREVVGWLATQ